ncbi:MAG: radical SAM protein [Candidatus Omnitrophica bacterium]|nr:radical SAM protein [Candidatus Omnitrophota bacterium]
MKRYLKYVRLVYKKPLLVFRIFSNYFKMYILRRNVLRKVDICLTLRCPCDCGKCSSAKMFDPKKGELSLEEVKEVAKQCLELGAIQLNLTGGDPLLRKDIFEIIKSLQPARVFISINTTGLLLDKNLIEKFKIAGVDMIKMSIDSPIASEHDRYRNNSGCYEKVMENLMRIREVGGIRSHISTVTVPENIKSGKILDILKITKKFNATLALTIPAPVGKWVDNYNILISSEDRETLNRLLEKHRLVTQDIDACYKEVRCPGGIESLYITSYGDIIPCSVLQISFGNIRRERLKTIYRRMLEFQPLKESLPVCKAGESKEFIDKWLRPIAKSDLFPVDIFNHPSFLKDGDKNKLGGA